jgi:hypothetical protein
MDANTAKAIVADIAAKQPVPSRKGSVVYTK